jgi:hypothetical protein
MTPGPRDAGFESWPGQIFYNQLSSLPDGRGCPEKGTLWWKLKGIRTRSFYECRETN